MICESIHSSGSSFRLRLVALSMVGKVVLVLSLVGAVLALDATASDLSTSYFSEDNSKLVLESTGRFGWMLNGDGQPRFMKGRWERSGDRVVLKVDKPGDGHALFELAGSRPWSEEDAGELRRSEEWHVRLDAYGRCPFLRTYEELAGRIMVALPLVAKADADEKSARTDGDRGREAAAVRQAAGNAERAVQSALQGISSGGRDAGHAEGMAAASEAVTAYWSAYADAASARMAFGEPADGLVMLKFDPTPCYDPLRVRALEKQDGDGYAVIVRETAPGNFVWRPEVVVEFFFDNGDHEARLSQESGWAGVPRGASRRLQRIGIHPVDRAYPPAVLEVDAGQGQAFDVRMQSSAVVQPPHERVEFAVENDDLVSPAHGWRYSCLGRCRESRRDDDAK